jgi:hypothetical protein
VRVYGSLGNQLFPPITKLELNIYLGALVWAMQFGSCIKAIERYRDQQEGPIQSIWPGTLDSKL